jgi:hypothetical protein
MRALYERSKPGTSGPGDVQCSCMPHAPDPQQQRLTDEELEDVVEEIAKDEARAGDGVSFDQAREALRELDLPADKLDEAALKVRQRREAAALAKKEKKRLLLSVAAGVAVLVAAVAGFASWRSAQAEKVAAITATSPVLTEEAGRLRLSAKLMSAPKGESVPMTCTWSGESGALLHENAWQTKPVSHDAWETHCVLPSAPEHVKVAMKAHGRVVAESSR